MLRELGILEYAPELAAKVVQTCLQPHRRALVPLNATPGNASIVMLAWHMLGLPEQQSRLQHADPAVILRVSYDTRVAENINAQEGVTGQDSQVEVWS